MAKITNTGQLRDFLCAAINAVGNGTMDAEKARNITKLAGQVNESLYAEVKVAKTKIELGVEADKIGSLMLGVGSETK
jgi:hypothetical protein